MPDRLNHQNDTIGRDHTNCCVGTTELGVCAADGRLFGCGNLLSSLYALFNTLTNSCNIVSRTLTACSMHRIKGYHDVCSWLGGIYCYNIYTLWSPSNPLVHAGTQSQAGTHDNNTTLDIDIHLTNQTKKIMASSIIKQVIYCAKPETVGCSCTC